METSLELLIWRRRLRRPIRFFNQFGRTIVEQLEKGDISLDTAIDAYTRGMSLKTHCQARLEEARLRVEKIKVPGGDAASVTAAPFDPAEM